MAIKGEIIIMGIFLSLANLETEYGILVFLKILRCNNQGIKESKTNKKLAFMKGF